MAKTVKERSASSENSSFSDIAPANATKFVYNGDFGIVNIEGQDYSLINGEEYNLPADNTKVKQFIKQGKLAYVTHKKAEVK